MSRPGGVESLQRRISSETDDSDLMLRQENEPSL